jgi:hypothetical protein
MSVTRGGLGLHLSLVTRSDEALVQPGACGGACVELVFVLIRGQACVELVFVLIRGGALYVELLFVLIRSCFVAVARQMGQG